MDKLYYKLLKSSYFVFFVLSLLYLYYRRIFILENSVSPIDQWMITSHLVTIVVNNTFLLYQMKKVGTIRAIKNNIIVRVGKTNLYKQLNRFSIKDLCVYFIGTYFVLTLIYIQTLTIIPVYIFFIMLNLCFFFFYQILFNYIIVEDKKTYYSIIPFVLNIVFHYLIVPLLFF